MTQVRRWRKKSFEISISFAAEKGGGAGATNIFWLPVLRKKVSSLIFSAGIFTNAILLQRERIQLWTELIFFAVKKGNETKGARKGLPSFSLSCLRYETNLFPYTVAMTHLTAAMEGNRHKKATPPPSSLICISFKAH